MTKAVTPWDQLAEPFPDSEVKQRPGPGGMTFAYVDARAVMQRLDDVLTPEGWDFEARAQGDIVHGKLIVLVGDRAIVREDYGYPNGPDDPEPIKSAVSDALKRCAVGIGVGRHLYSDNAAHRPTVAQRPQVVPDGSWVCPEHGGGRVRSNARGLYCSTKIGEDESGKAIWCRHTDSERAIEARPKPPLPEPPMDELPF